MKLLSISKLFAFALVSTAAYAQSGVYATFDAQQFTRTGLLQSPLAGTSNSDSPWLYGPTFGAFFTISHIPRLGTLHTGPVRLGIDGRGDILRTNALFSRDDGIISLRLTLKKPLMRLLPYVQGGAGIGHTRVPAHSYFSNNWSYLLAAGVDRKIKGRLNWRVVEGSAGFLGSYQSGYSSNNNNYMYTLSSGIVLSLGSK